MMVAKQQLATISHDSPLSSPDYEISTPLRPYKHQVGGHVAIFELDEDHVGKPYNQLEANFYGTMPGELSQFTPEYCFEIELKPNSFTGAYDLCILNSNPTSSHQHSDCQQLVPPVCSTENNDDRQCEFRDIFSGITNDKNPWSIECQLRLMKDDQHRVNRFIVFENLSRGYQFPSILDLKLGTRQYSEHATDEKKNSQKRKCEKSTSKSLGMRLCGLQYYDEKMRAFQCLDKYYGRNLSDKSLITLLSQFFRSADGKIRRDDCLALMEQIEKIRDTVASIPGLRLFGVSMLILLEGKMDLPNQRAPIARLIDFNHASVDPNDSMVDHGCLLGLENLLTTIRGLLD